MIYIKLPEKPINWRNFLRRDSYDYKLKIFLSEELLNEAIKFNKQYLYWSELKYKIKNEDEREKIWAWMKILRDRNYKEQNIGKINIKYNIISQFNEKFHEFDKSLAGNIETSSDELSLDKRYIFDSLIEEAISSSKIEGASTTRVVAKNMIVEDRKPKTIDEKMIFNNFRTMKYLSTIKDSEMTPDLLLDIHKKITIDTLEKDEYEGNFRKIDVEIGSSIYRIVAHTPPSHTEIQKLIKEFCDFVNDDSGDFIHPIVKGIIIHFLICYIHPFTDGNGRTARSVFYWYMLHKGYWLFEYMPLSKIILRSRKKYDDVYLYTEYDELDVTYFIKYNIECINQCLKELKDYINEERTKYSDWSNIIPTINSRQNTILRKFKERPNKTFVIKEIARLFGTVYQTARTDLMFLNENKMINMKKSGKKLVFIFNKEWKSHYKNV